MVLGYYNIKEIFDEKLDKLKIVRNVVNAAIEIKRSSKEIGSSLEANVQIYLGEMYLKLVKDLCCNTSILLWHIQ